MGHRTNLVLRRDGRWLLFYDHWAANALDAELFWGPELAEAFMVAREPSGSSAGGDDAQAFLDEVWCEGAALLDHDAQRLLWYGGEDVLYDLYDRRAHLELMRRNWPGWRVDWAHGGIAEIVAALGLDPSPVLVPDTTSEGLALNGWAQESGDFLLMWTRDGAARARRCDGWRDALMVGPEAVGRATAPDAGAERLTWLQPEPDRTGLEPPPARGAHVDYDARRLAYYSVDAALDVEKRLAAAWPGFEITWFRDDLDALLADCDARVDVPVFDRNARTLERIAALRGKVDREARNFAAEIAQSRIDAGHDVQLNPLTDVTRGSVGDAAAKTALLDRLQAAVGGTPSASNAPISDQSASDAPAAETSTHVEKDGARPRRGLWRKLFGGGG